MGDKENAGGTTIKIELHTEALFICDFIGSGSAESFKAEPNARLGCGECVYQSSF